MKSHPLRHCCLITSNNHHTDSTVFSQHDDLLCEAMLPDIRTLATMMATSRHDFSQPHIHQFTDEADWFAARLLVLNVRVFHLNIQQLPMLNLANQRAATFAKMHGLPFQPAQIRASLHSHRSENMLLIECDLSGQALPNWIENTRAVRRELTSHLCHFSCGKTLFNHHNIHA